MAFHTYILRCRDGSYYVGHTDDLERRIAQHQTGALGGYTAKRLPVEFLWAESFQTRDDAFAAERKLKGWSRAKKEAMMAGDWTLVSQLARSPANALHQIQSHPNMVIHHDLAIRGAFPYSGADSLSNPGASDIAAKAKAHRIAT